MDYSSFSVNGTGVKDSQNINKKWWMLSGQAAAESITSIVGFLHQHQGARQTQYIISSRLYGNLAIMGLNGLTYSKVASVQNSLKDRISFNVCKSAVDTVTSKITKNSPKSMFLTNKGEWHTQRKAEKLNQYCDGINYENEMDKLAPLLFRDSGIFGNGFNHVYADHDRVKYERTIPGEILVDEIEAFYGNPRQLFRVKNVDRMLLADTFPKKRGMIMDANSATPDNLGAYPNISDAVTVTEAWHLPSGPEAKDGAKKIILNNGEVDASDWDKQYFPFANMPWSKRLHGFYGMGAIEEIQNIQLEINKILWVIQRSMHLMGAFKIWLKNGSKVVKEHLNNDIGAIITGDEQPVYLTPPAVPEQYFNRLDWLVQKAYESVGVSMLSAASQKPAGLNSGKSLREFHDIESDRFETIGKAYEQLHLDTDKLAIMTAREIYKDTGKYSVKVPGKKFIQTIDWADIDLSDDEFIMKAYPVSSLPDDPAGRLQTIQEYAQAGFIQPRQARRLLDFPDLDQVESLANAAEDYLHEILEKMTDEGIYTPPEPFDDLSLARELALEYYQRGKTNNLEEDRLEMLRRFLEQVNVLMQQAQQPPPQQAMPSPQAQPQALPSPRPVSDLLPNVPQQATA